MRFHPTVALLLYLVAVDVEAGEAVQYCGYYLELADLPEDVGWDLVVGKAVWRCVNRRRELLPETGSMAAGRVA